MTLTKPSPLSYMIHAGPAAGRKVVIHHPSAIKDRDGVAVLDAGTVRHDGRDRHLFVRYDDKPDLATAVAQWRAEWDAYDQAVEQAAREARPIGVDYEYGCDVADRIVVRYDSDSDLPNAVLDKIVSIHEREERLIEAALKSLGVDKIDALAERTVAERIPGNAVTYRGWRFGAAALAELRVIGAELQAKRQESRAAQERNLASISVPAEAVGAYEVCRGNPEAFEDDIDDPRYWLVREYAEAIEAQGLATDASLAKFARQAGEAARESSFGGGGE